MAVITISEARAALPNVVNRVADGEEVTITRYGRPAAVLVRPDVVWSQSAMDIGVIELRGLVEALRERARRHGLTLAQELDTKPEDKNGLGLKPAEAVGNVRAIRDRTTVLEEDSRVADRLMRLLDDVECGGKQVHDANMIATMLVHGVGTVVTMNTDDFARFTSYVSLMRL
jgi:antitoxin (DNA-binding transcriptional repressor) of toxin-antitoxin stability system